MPEQARISTATLLVFLAGAAGARVVAADAGSGGDGYELLLLALAEDRVEAPLVVLAREEASLAVVVNGAVEAVARGEGDSAFFVVGAAVLGIVDGQAEPLGLA